jgi:carbohydrate-binding DOMON domain-containing protein
VTRQQQGTTLTVTSPADQSAATGTVTVTGTAAPGATIDIVDVATDHGSATTRTQAAAAADGSFSQAVTLATGTNTFVITSTTSGGATAQTTRTVVEDIVAGTLLYNVQDPTGDDNGAGNYVYPTASDFHPGAYDMTDFQVYDTGSTVTFRVQTRDLTPTFGSPLGAQLINVYVHQPAASPTSTAASFPQRNYTIAPAGAWSRMLEVQGFGQRFIDATGATPGTITISANQISRYITFSVTKAALGGTPTTGWGFTVTLAGQDGFSSDNARAFTATPGAYSFGECAAASTDPHCTVNPSAVPKVMDTLTPAGTKQSNELDYTLHNPVVLQPVLMP